MAYIPDCNDSETRRILPTLCSYPPDIRAQICERQPSLCYPVDYDPSIWEPIIGTVKGVGEKILMTEAAVGTGVLKTLDLASIAMTVLPFLLVGGGVFYLMQSTKR